MAIEHRNRKEAGPSTPEGFALMAQSPEQQEEHNHG
jgi:hypothetical protein